MTPKTGHLICLILLFTLPALRSLGQLEKITFDLAKEKPQKFEERVLKSEKTGQKKFSLLRKFSQNTGSHYNYYFNANNKINSIIERARIAQTDDYTRLLPYYSYSLDNTSSQKNDLDSVLQKATAGILLHDLRTNWVDNFYMLIGKAYYLRKDFDSAYMAFQFINFNLYPKNNKNKDEPLIIGSNENGAAGTLSISSKEDRNFFKKILSKPPSRNDALVWQALALTQMGKYAEASGLINTLKNDPAFPKRLQIQLNEVQGFWFYSQNMYDSAINYIQLALPNSLDLQDRARREFILGQLFEMKPDVDSSAYYYTKAIHHTTNPLLDIYANLNKAKLLRDQNPDEIQNSISHLMAMSRKDKYDGYRHIIYLAAGDLAMDIPDTTEALILYNKSAAANKNNIILKNQAFLKLADISYSNRKYKDAYRFYDSLQTTEDSTLDRDRINEKKAGLFQVVKQINIIDREDSLQSIAAMTTADREAYLKKLSKKLRKERGITDDDGSVFGNAFDAFNKNNTSLDIFSGNNSKGDWYFYNNDLKSKGYNTFIQQWGKRQNVDNWRRVSNTGLATSIRQENTHDMGTPDSDPMNPSKKSLAQESNADLSAPVQEDISVDGLRANLPLTQPLLDSSNSKKAKALFQLGENYQNLLEDFPAAISTFETSLNLYPDSLYEGKLYLDLATCYNQLGNNAMSEKYRNLLTNRFANSSYADRVLHPEKFIEPAKDSAAANRYDKIYTSFIEGNFTQAITDKKAADSLYGTTYWNPQLLYIESVYYIKQRQDSDAIAILKQIQTKYAASPMSDKASDLIRVLSKRDSIENYLTNLKVERVKEDSQIVVFDDTRIFGNIGQRPVRNDSNLLPRKITTVNVPELAADKRTPAPLKNKEFIFDPLTTQNVVMILTKVDPVYSSEARNAFNRYNQQNFYNQTIAVTKDTLDADRTMLVFRNFISADAAMKYLERIRHDAPTEISWLPSNKYVFYIISDANLELLKENKQLDSYLKLLKEKYPDKF